MTTDPGKLALAALAALAEAVGAVTVDDLAQDRIGGP